MTRHVALLRGVNVGGNKGVRMSDLKALAARLSLGRPQTLLQSGNLVFDADGATPAALEARLEAAIAAELGVRTEVCVRPRGVWERLIAANPFPEAAEADPAHLVLIAFKTPPQPDAGAAIAAEYVGPEQVAVAEGHAYIVYPEGIGRSKLPQALLGRHLGQGTARNWNTVLKLAELLAR